MIYELEATPARGSRSGDSRRIVIETTTARVQDPAVLINLPRTPSAHAYEAAEKRKNPADGYFSPVFVDVRSDESTHRK